MAKRILLDILVKVLGEYIELDAENFDLSLAVWSGHIALKNLKLRSHKLFRDLGLSIVYGEIHSLEVIIPWASLLSSPVKILIDGINLQVGPLDAAQLGKKEIREQLISSKMDQLRIADESIDYNGTAKALEGADKGKTTPKTAANTKATYVQQWTAKIIDNLEITLKNVHIRYEDSQTLPGSNFSAGVTLKSFTVSSCDENWTEKFIGRDLNKARTAMRKLAKISNLGLYWMTKSAVLAGMPFVDWSSQMNSLISSGSSLNASSIKDIDYLMHPDSSLLLKLIHDDSNKSIPKFDISLESSDFLFSVDRTQYLQLMCTMKAMDSVRTIRQPLVDRPQERPASSKDCVIWWKYAIKLVMRKKEYIRLVKLSRTADQDGHMDIRTEGEKARTRVLEMWIPLRTLVIFRHACAKELQAEAHERHEHLVKVALENGLKCPVLPVKEEPRSWIGWMRGTAKTAGKVKEVTEDDDVSLESIITSLEHADGIVEEDVTPEYKVCVTTSATLNLSVDGSQFATATMALSVVAETSAQGMTATAHLCDLLVIDKCSIKPMNPNIIAVKQKIKSPSKASVSNVVTEVLAPKERILNATPSFSIVYEKLGSKTKARLTALPVEITLNKMCIQQLVGFFLPSPAAPPAILEAPLKNTHAAEIHHADGGEGSFLHVVDSTKSPDHKTQNEEKDRDIDEDEDEEIFEVIFEAHAPNIIIPEGDSANCGCFLLDTGYITVKGVMKSCGMSFDVSLKDINIGMPRNLADMDALGQQSLYLIKPFNFGLMMQTLDQKAADMTVDIALEPELRGELDPLKLARILKLIPVLSTTFSIGDCLTTVSASDIAVYGTDQPYVMPMLPMGDDSEVLSLADIVKRTIASTDTTVNKSIIVVDPMIVSMSVNIKIPEVALDLTYDPLRARHLVLAVRALEMQVLMRSRDMQVSFDLSELSIQDSLRSDSQQDLARTPRGDDRLIHISYIAMTSPLSPLYKKHATEIVVKFATLELNVDVKTIMNLRPFMEILLQKSPPQPVLDLPQAALTAPTIDQEVAVKGMHVLFTVSNVTLDLLRHSLEDADGEELENTFSLQIEDLRVDMDMVDLMNVDVRLHSIEISDVRDVSSDYVFRKIMCPVMDMDKTLAVWKANAAITAREAPKSDKSTASTSSEVKGVEPSPDLLCVKYAQSSKDVSEVDITVLNITAFVSMDTVMDLVNVALANTDAVMRLMAAPLAPIVTTEVPPSHTPSRRSNSYAPPLIPQLPKQLEGSSTTMKVSVQVKNPNMILLDDPTTDESRAVTASCDIDVHYAVVRTLLLTKDVLTDKQNSNQTESLHVSVRDNQVSVLRSMLVRQPQPILEPMGIEFNLKKKYANDLLLSSAMSLDLDNVTMRVSTKDIALAQSIMTRRVLFQPAAPTLPPTETTDPAAALLEEEAPIMASPTVSTSVNMGCLSLVAINDFNGQNVPVLRFILDGTKYMADGNEEVSSGEGSLTAIAEFYNSRLSVWEPILDKWHPSVTVTTWTTGSYIDIRADQTLQLTVSGIMLEKILQTYYLFFEEDSCTHREEVPDILISNSLGPGIAFDVYDSATNKKVLSLKDMEAKPVPRVSNQTRLNHMISVADIVFTGPLGTQRDALRHLPFNINRPKICNLQIRHSGGEGKGPDVFDNTGKVQDMSMSTILEAIEEEVFENARYDLLTARWRHPFLANDPYEWTDASGTIRKDLQTITISSNWEWGGPWSVDMDAIGGDEIDSDGWEYGNNFTNFSISNRRRNQNPLDCVRRRRWLRPRVPIAGNTDERLRPLTVFWDVQVLQSGTRKVDVRSSLQVHNTMPFAIIISVGGSVWAADTEFGPIPENQTFNVPLMHASASWIKIRLADFPYIFCNQILCGLQMHDFESARDVQCEGEGGVDGIHNPVCMRVLCTQQNKSMTVTIAPTMLIFNKLPCNMKYSCTSSGKRRDEGNLLPGSSCKVVNVDTAFQPEISLAVGNLKWTGSIALNTVKADGLRVDALYPDGSIGAILSISVVNDVRTGTVVVSVHSKGALCDRTGGLGVSLATRRTVTPKIEILRDTFTPDMTQIIVCPYASTLEKSKRASRLKAEEKANKELLISPADDSVRPVWTMKQKSIAPLLSTKIGSTKEKDGGDAEEAVKSTTLSSKDGGQAQEISNIENFEVFSTRVYSLETIDVGDHVYSDRPLRWTYLPPQLKRQKCIRTACDDEMVRSKKMIQFTVDQSSLVLILMDMRGTHPPVWVTEGGYSHMSDQAIARLAVAGVVYETYYGIYGKFIKGGEVVLGGNWSKESHSMYSVFIIPVPPDVSQSYLETSEDSPPKLSGTEDDSYPDQAQHTPHSPQGKLQRMYEEATAIHTYRRSDADACWISGGKSVSLFHADDNLVTVGIQGNAWSEEFKIDMVNSPRTGSFEAIDSETFRAYQLSYSMAFMPGIFCGTQMVTITPRYCIVNCVEEVIMVAQRGANEVLEISPFHAEGWHKSKSYLGTTVQIRTASSVWSLGTIDLNEVGRSIIHLPGREGPGSASMVVLVEVKVAEPSDHCSVVVVIWQATVETGTALAIRNETDVSITVCQADLENNQAAESIFEVCVGPSKHVPFGWADPDSSTDVLVTVGTCLSGAVRVGKVNFLKAGGIVKLADNSGRSGTDNELLLSVVAEGGSRVLRISRSTGTEMLVCTSTDNGATVSCKSIDSDGKEVKENMKSFGFSLSLASVGLSLVVEKPIRREFFSLYLDCLEAKMKTKGALKSFEFIIMDVQLDNYSETGVYPVLIHSMRKSNKMDISDHKRPQGAAPDSTSRKEGDINPHGVSDVYGDVPLLQISLIEETRNASSTLKYVAVRLMPIAIEVDSASIQLLFSDFISDLKYVDKDETLAVAAPDTWIEDYNKKLLSPWDRVVLVDVHRSRVSAQASQMYIEKLIIHPVKLLLTFVKTDFPRHTGKDSFSTAALNVLTSFVGVDRMQIKLKSFEVDDALESSSSLIGLIKHKAMQDIQYQLAQMAGSLTAIGAPMGFARKVGSGVKSFFYEPYQGAILGPQDFIRGLSKGTHHLVTNVVSGAMTSTAGIVGSASKGIGLLSGDAEYVRKRSLKNQQDRASRGGIMDGLMDGGESVVSGIASGVSGLVTKPYEEAKKGGVQGFFKGVGLGIMGVALKPVMGVTDGLTSVVSGISNQVEKVTVYVIVRHPRAFERSASDANDLVLVPLNLEAAFAQEFVRKRSLAGHYPDSYLNYIAMDVPDESIVLSEAFLYWRQAKVLWGRSWSNISHVFFVLDSVGIVLYGGETEAVIIPCGSEQCAMRVYSALANNAHRMGYPSHVIPLDLITQESTLSEAGRDNLMNRRMQAASLAGMMDNYRFGNANKTTLKKVGGHEAAVFKRMEAVLNAGYSSWAQLDEAVWRLVWEWDCSHVALQASRCCATLIINRSRSPLQIARVQIVVGRNVLLMGSPATGFDADSRVIMPGGSALIFIWAFSPTPLEHGHLKASISTAAFSATVASVQRDSSCEARGGFTTGFLEKTVSEWWSKYVILVK